MIAIISGSIDKSTDMVCEYLENENIKYLRINLDNLYSKSEKLPYFILQDENLVLWVKTISYPSWKYGWAQEQQKIVHSVIVENIYSFIYLLHKKAKVILGFPIDKGYFFTKIHSLDIANQCGLNVPHWHFVSTKEELLIHSQQYPLITKASSEIVTFDDGTNKFKSFTVVIDNNYIENMDETFALSFVQEQILKSFDVKILYLLGNMYGIGIISKNNQHNKDKFIVDFRAIDRNELKFFIFDLNKTITDKINKYMSEINANFGVLDFILGLDNKMYFIEFNPYGNFNNISEKSNLNFEKKIAQCLTQIATQKK